MKSGLKRIMHHGKLKLKISKYKKTEYYQVFGFIRIFKKIQNVKGSIIE